MLAASEGHREIVELLLQYGADDKVAMDSGVTAFSCAVGQSRDVETVKLLLMRGADVNAGFEPPLMGAATGRNIEILNLLLRNGANIDATDDEGFTALMEPAWYGYQDVVERLIEAGIDVNIRNREGFTALDYAKKYHRREIIDLLRKAGATE